jgi:hypothetical protein
MYNKNAVYPNTIMFYCMNYILSFVVIVFLSYAIYRALFSTNTLSWIVIVLVH